jgi:hypothetical protein
LRAGDIWRDPAGECSGPQPESNTRCKKLILAFDEFQWLAGASPTLARWLERHDPRAARRIRQGDATQC